MSLTTYWIKRRETLAKPRSGIAVSHWMVKSFVAHWSSGTVETFETCQRTSPEGTRACDAMDMLKRITEGPVERDVGLEVIKVGWSNEPPLPITCQRCTRIYIEHMLSPYFIK